MSLNSFDHNPILLDPPKGIYEEVGEIFFMEYPSWNPLFVDRSLLPNFDNYPKEVLAMEKADMYLPLDEGEVNMDPSKKDPNLLWNNLKTK